MTPISKTIANIDFHPTRIRASYLCDYNGKHFVITVIQREATYGRAYLCAYVGLTVDEYYHVRSHPDTENLVSYLGVESDEIAVPDSVLRVVFLDHFEFYAGIDSGLPRPTLEEMINRVLLIADKLFRICEESDARTKSLKDSGISG